MSHQRLAITSGDSDGIGLEVTSKALQQLRPQADRTIYLWRSPEASPKDLRRIDRRYQRITVNSWSEAMEVTQIKARSLIDISSRLSPARWVEISAEACLTGTIDGIVTAPLSKLTILQAGLTDLGHTDILKRVAKVGQVHMGFLGPKMNIVLATGHIPLFSVPAQLNSEVLSSSFAAAQKLRRLLPKKRQALPIALLGLNPHAGEQGLIGKEEESLRTWLNQQKAFKDGDLIGPLVPDAAFFEKNRKQVSVYIALYHDQGLIPFKLLHGHKAGVHVSLGLPIVRTSVDHGTAKDIAGKGIANYESMLEAIQVCGKLCQLTGKT